MRALFYDTETTGLPLFSEPSEDPRQPHMVQLAACLVDLDTRKRISTMDVIIYPLGYQIPEEVAKIHGITTGYAIDHGVSESLATEMLMQLWKRCHVRIGHNEQFDARILRIALMRHNGRIGIDPDLWKASKAECTQALSTPILKLPPTPKMIAAGRHHHKSANLGEAYKHFTGNEFVGAHSAIADVEACMAVYFAIKDGKEKAA